jgi:hypothetical protein
VNDLDSQRYKEVYEYSSWSRSMRSSVIRIPRAGLEEFESRFNYASSRKQMKHSSEYVSYRIISDSDFNFFGIEVHEMSSNVSYKPASDLSHLVCFLEGIKQLQGFPLSNRIYLDLEGDDHPSLFHWAHAYLEGSVGLRQEELLATLPEKLVSLLPKEIQIKPNINDWLCWCYQHGIFKVPTMTYKPYDPSDLIGRDVTPNHGEAVKVLKSKQISLSMGSRARIYEILLGYSPTLSCEDFAEPHEAIAMVFLKRFAQLVFHDRRCTESTRHLSIRFFHRVVLDSLNEDVMKYLRIIDPPLAYHLQGIKVLDELKTSIFACTLSDADLLYLWDKLLVSGPEVLSKVVTFALVEVRDFLMVLDDNFEDVVLTIGELVTDFKSVVDLATDDDSL